ncbi:MAG: hypothetical protein JRH15_17915, partial [Deltaproteobacteria bacterium]|nr:hypothetical protein [Deltaproteobacteria bacterium]
LEKVVSPEAAATPQEPTSGEADTKPPLADASHSGKVISLADLKGRSS